MQYLIFVNKSYGKVKIKNPVSKDLEIVRIFPLDLLQN
jgi:hypothetical protein